MPSGSSAFQLAAAEDLATAGEGVPRFVYGSVATPSLRLGNGAVDTVPHDEQAGRWRSGFVAEKAAVGLGLVAKTALAWRVCANLLVDEAGEQPPPRRVSIQHPRAPVLVYY